MLQTIEQTAWISVARGCGFTALGIATFMFGMSADHISTAFTGGGLLVLLLCLVLVLKSYLLRQRNYRDTELWMLLDPKDRPNDAIAPAVIISVLRETYLRFSMHAAAIATGFLIISLLTAP